MTGLYPSQAGIGDFTTPKPSPTRGPGYLGRLNDHCVTLAEVLKPAGYGCYYVGKWHMHEQTGPIRRGFDEFYGFTRDHSHDQYDADYYIRLPEGRKKEIDPPQGEFYATDVFNEYALEFIRQGQRSGKPWFLFLGHSSPHFPVQAPAERADKYDATYLRGWDVLREERFARMQEIGLIDGEHWKLTPRSLVPVDRDDIANGFSGRAESGLGFARRSPPARPRPADGRLRGDGRAGRSGRRADRRPPESDRRLGQHADPVPQRQRRLLRVGAVRIRRPVAPRHDDAAHRRRPAQDRRPRHAPFLRQCLGQSRQHAVSPLQALHARGRHQHAVHRPLAERDRHAG